MIRANTRRSRPPRGRDRAAPLHHRLSTRLLRNRAKRGRDVSQESSARTSQDRPHLISICDPGRLANGSRLVVLAPSSSIVRAADGSPANTRCEPSRGWFVQTPGCVDTTEWPDTLVLAGRPQGKVCMLAGRCGDRLDLTEVEAAASAAPVAILLASALVASALCADLVHAARPAMQASTSTGARPLDMP